MIKLNPIFSVLVLADPGFFRDGLITILQSHPRVGSVEAAAVIDLLAGRGPAQAEIILLDCSMSRPSPAVIQDIRSQYPNGLLIAIVASSHQIPNAVKYGATTALVEGFSNQALFDLIRDLTLPQQVGAVTAAEIEKES